MEDMDRIQENGEEAEELRTRIKHLTNELALVEEENSRSREDYYDIFSTLERKVRERTRELEATQRLLELKLHEIQLIIDSSPELIFQKDLSGRYLQVNRPFLKAFGKTPEEVVGKRDDEVFGPHEADPLADHPERLAEGGPFHRTEGDILTVRGKRSVVIERFPFRDGRHRLRGLLGFVLDITDIKRAEKERLQLQERVARAEEMEALGILAGGIAHDSNNILGGLTGYLQLVLMNFPKEHEDRPYLESAVSSIGKMSELVQDLLTLARRGVRKTEILNVNRQIEEYFQTGVHTGMMKNCSRISLETVMDESLMNIRGKPALVEKVIMNLVTNAAEAIPENGSITVRTANILLEQVRQGYGLRIEPGNYVMLEVADTGSGICPQDLPHIFEPFYTRKRMDRSGSGLGLAVVYGTVKDHKGLVEVESSPGKGSTFRIFFPAVSDPLPEEKHQPDDALPEGNGEHLLVIDDREDQRRIAHELLSRLGYTVDVASSGRDALKHLGSRKADLVLIDMVLGPGWDGLESYREILKLNPAQRAIIVSGYADPRRLEQCRSLGVRVFVRKPYSVRTLGAAVRAALEGMEFEDPFADS